MSGSIPSAPSSVLPVQFVNRGFCRALLAIYDYRAQMADFVKSGNDSMKPNEKQSARAAIAQSYFFRLGLNPWPTTDIEMAAKQALAALVTKLEAARKEWETAYNAAYASGKSVMDSWEAADKATLPFSITDFTNGLTQAEHAGINVLKSAFSYVDPADGKTKPIIVNFKSKPIFQPATTNLEKCQSLTEIKTILDAEIKSEAHQAAIARGANSESVYGKLELRVDPDTDFEAYSRSYRDMVRDLPEPPSGGIYTRAPANPNQPLTSIYGRVEGFIDTPPDMNGKVYDAIDAPFVDPNDGAP